MAAVALLTLFTVVSGIIAEGSLSKLQRGFERVASTQLDVLMAASELRQESEAAAGFAPNLYVKGLEQGTLLNYSLQIYSEHSRLDALVKKLSSFTGPAADIGAINRASASLFKNIDALSTAIFDKAHAADTLNVALLASTNFQGNIAAGLERSPSGHSGFAADWISLIHRTNPLVMNAIASNDAKLQAAMQAETTRVMAKAGELAQQAKADFPEILMANTGIANALNGPQGVFASLKQLASSDAKLKNLLADNERMAVDLTSAVSALMKGVQADVGDQNSVQRDFLSSRTKLLQYLTLLGIIAAILTAIYVQYSVIRRMNRLRRAMLSEQSVSDLTPLTIGSDEISDLARSFVSFSDAISLSEMRLAEQNRMLEGLSNKLSKYLSPQVYGVIFTGKQNVEISSKRKKLTIFFSDIANFTGITDKLESEELTELLNNYLTEMSKIALEYGATIDKYIGDAILAFFGDPDTKGVKEDALAGVRMAIAMQRRMRDLQSEWMDSGAETPFKLRIGVNTGFCTVGNFGSADRMDYTIIGGEVNLASRLQSHAEIGGILIAHETYALVKDHVRTEELEPIVVKGFADPVRTYRILGIYGDMTEEEHVIRHHEPGLKIDVDLERLSQTGRAKAVQAIEGILAKLRH